MAAGIQVSGIMVSLDTLFDTRLGTLIQYYEDESVANILRDNYALRLSDQFDDISIDEFKELYAQRNRETLRQSPPTPIQMLVREFVTNTLTQNMSSPFHSKPKIYINIHPYKLEESEINAIVSGMAMSTYGDCDVVAVDMPDEEITPMWVKENLTMLVHYNYMQWLELHCANKNFEKVTCPEVGLLGPMIYYDKMPSKSEMDEYRKNNYSPFDDVEESGRYFIGIKLYPVEHFSFSIPPDSIKPPG